MSYNSNDHYVEINANRLESQYLKDLLSYRELLYFFAWRDIVVRYKEAFFGIAWALIRPLINMVIFAIVFGKIANLSSQNVNYPAFVLAGLLPWQLCSQAAAEGSFSVLNNAHLISKIYFPRIIIPIAQIGVHLLDFLVGLVFLFIFCLFVQPLNWITVIMLPIFIAQAIVLSVGASLWLSALTVNFKDIRFLVPFCVQIGMFISPVGYGTNIISDQWMWLFCLNPMAGIIDGFRWALFGETHALFAYSLTVSFATTVFVLFSGFKYFRKTEKSFVDRI